MRTKGSGSFLLLALLTVAGCGSSAARAVTAPTATPRAVARVDASLAPAIGRLLAVTDLLGDADTLLTSAYAAQDEQLPDSAHADFFDAGTKLSAAQFAAGDAGRQPSLRPADDLIARSISAYRRADAEGMSRPDASKTLSASARRYVDRAVAILESRAEALLPGADSARRQALARAIRATVPHHSPPARIHRHPPATPRARLVVVVSTSTPAKQARQRPPIAVRVTRIALPAPSQLRIRPASTPRRHRPPVSKQRARIHKRVTRVIHPPAPGVPGPSIRATASVAVRAKETTRLLVGASAAVSESSAIGRCSAQIESLASGNDPTGATPILACIDRAVRPLSRLLAETARRLKTHLPSGVRGYLKGALRAARRAGRELHQAKRAVQAAAIDRAATHLAAAGRAMQRASVRLHAAASTLSSG